MSSSESSFVKVVGFLSILLILVIGLVFVWRAFPRDLGKPVNPAPMATSTEPIAAGGVTKAVCEAAKGHWTECGSPCHGKQNEVCVQVCEAQCLCGGIAGWQCPSKLTCTDYDPSPTTPDALGVCRVVSPTSTVPVVPVGFVCGEGQGICVKKITTLSNPILVTGEARVFEGQFSWKLLDGTGKEIESGFAMAGRTGMFANYGTSQVGEYYEPFQIRAMFTSLPHTATGTLVLFDNSAKDGEQINTLNLPVKLPTLTQEVKLFLAAKGDPNRLDCGLTEMVRVPIVKTQNIAEATLLQLLHLPPASEIQNHTSDIPKGTELLSFTVASGTARVALSAEADAGGSCRTAAIRAQIEQTLKQFSSIKQVVISVGGKTPEESLQP